MIQLPNYPGLFIVSNIEIMMFFILGMIFFLGIFSLFFIIVDYLKRKKEYLATLSDKEYRKYKEYLRE